MYRAYSIYLGPKVVRQEHVWALSICRIHTWSVFGSNKNRFRGRVLLIVSLHGVSLKYKIWGLHCGPPVLGEEYKCGCTHSDVIRLLQGKLKPCIGGRREIQEHVGSVPANCRIATTTLTWDLSREQRARPRARTVYTPETELNTFCLTSA